MKKSNMCLLLSSITCLESKEIKQKLLYIIKKLKNIYDIYDVSKNIIENEEQFNEIHRILVLDKRKPVSFFVKNQDKNGKDKYEFTLKKNRFKKAIISEKKFRKYINVYI